MFGLVNIEDLRKEILDGLSEISSNLYCKGDENNRRKIMNLIRDVSSCSLNRKNAKALKNIVLNISVESGRATPRANTIKKLISDAFNLTSVVNNKNIINEEIHDSDRAMDKAEEIKEEILSLEGELKGIENRLNSKTRVLSSTDFKSLTMQAKNLRIRLSSKQDSYDKCLKVNSNLQGAETLLDAKSDNEAITELNGKIDVEEIKGAASVINQTSSDVQQVSETIDSITGDVSLNANEELDNEYQRYLENMQADKLDESEESLKAKGKAGKVKTN